MQETVHMLPFGRHAGKPLPDVDTSYLQWCLSTCKLSSGLRTAVAAELSSRGVVALVAPPPAPPQCRRCPGAMVRYSWLQTRNARRQCRQCDECGAWLGNVRQCEPFTSMADAAASPAPILDVLLLAETEGVNLTVRAGVADFGSYQDYYSASPALRDALRQCRLSLAAHLRNGGDHGD